MGAGNFALVCFQISFFLAHLITTDDDVDEEEEERKKMKRRTSSISEY